ncbi:hypothetical protein SAMN02745830_04972 [Streptomyces sp. Amel2xC10]|nr:hypothetical protein SAMN02745830_04972 [Streptomyces sp. Amel2xC10]
MEYGTANEGVRRVDHCANERDRPEAPAMTARRVRRLHAG